MIDDHSFISPIFLTLLEYFHNTRIIPQFHLHRSSLIHPSSSASILFFYENAIEWCIVNITYSKSFSFDWFTMNAYAAPFIDSNYLHASLAIDTSYISNKYRNFCVKNVLRSITIYTFLVQSKVLIFFTNSCLIIILTRLTWNYYCTTA